MIIKQNDIFFFKRFSVDQTGCAMKVNTDGVLLGALVETDKTSKFLDIGTGTGVISLMLAQRFPEAKIDAVEIEEEAALMAETNFKNSAFSSKLRLFHSSYKELFRKFPDIKYDLIVSNPPFFIDSQQSKDPAKNVAKHTNQNFFGELIDQAGKHLNESGKLILIIPVLISENINNLARRSGLFMQNKIEISSFPGADPHREIVIFGFTMKPIIKKSFIIYQQPKEYSFEYKTLLKDFLIIF